MIRSALILVCIGSFIPIKVMAIEISEVAWMGSEDSANHEWIELYSPETIDVTGWSISDGNNLLIELSGTVDSGDYAVLERTSDASASGAAWQIYTGSLVNTGQTLTLRDASGAVVDRVVGGDNWQLIGGDNSTKATAQLSANGWITSSPTPGQAASGVTQASVSGQTDQDDEDDEQDDTQSSSQTTSNQSSTNESIKLTLPDITLQLAIDAPKTTYVHQPVNFTVTPSGVGSTIAGSLTYTWSFGDTTISGGKTTKHTYSHAGNYVVVVEAQYKRQIQRTRHQIVVLPVSLTLHELPSGDIAIQNTSQTEIDIGGYRLVGNQSFTIPDYTILLPQSEIVVKRESFVTTSIPQVVALYDQMQHEVALHVPTQLASKSEALAVSPPPARPTSRISASDASSRYTFAAANTAEPTPVPDSEVATSTKLQPPTQVAAAGAATLPSNWPRFALVGVLLLGIAAVYLVPQPAKPDGPLA